ncbi:hypothetical protein [Actinophytocola glycyrrhizae]|uniref:GGDEF domain-containing protein n=1 Tax=Actinophytocola glycyrrhizae TaxID=2044873 RepID=A0ABV9SFY0_9PSEU
MAAAWNDLPATGGLHECAALVSSAEALRVSAPELSVQLARRALLVGATDASAGTTNIGEATDLSMRAQALLASGLVRISQHAKAVEPGFAALALAESGGVSDVAAQVRIDLAACAQQVGEPLLGGAILRPVLEAPHTPPSLRAAALGRLVGCVGHVARRDDVEDALAEADRLLAADDTISTDVRRMERARLAVRSASYHRWYGDTEDAVTSAREGLNLLTRLRTDLRSESDRLRARLSLELVCGLLDEGESREAEHAAHPTVDEPVRATSAASVGRLMLALASRVYLPSGQIDRGRHLLDQAAWLAERHALDGLRADALTEVSRLDEQAGRAAAALEAMRTARAAEHRRMRAMSRAARHVLVEVGANHGVRDTTQQSVAALMRQLAHPAGLPAAVAPPAQVAQAKPVRDPQTVPAAPELAGTIAMDDEGTRLLDREALFRRLRSGERPVALTLVRFEQNHDGDKAADRGPDTGTMAGLADKVRDMAPDNAEVARSDGGELAVLLPATTRDQAEEFAATIRESDWVGAGGKDMNISTGVVQTDQPTTDAADILTAARDALTPAQTSPDAPPLTNTPAAPRSALSEETPTTPLTHPRPGDQTTQTGRSILSSLSITSGSGGRRRAGEEQPPGATSRRPAEPAEAPRWTRAERRAHREATQPITPPPADRPAPPEEPGQGKRAATPTRPPFSETHTAEPAAATNRPGLPTRHGRPPHHETASQANNENQHSSDVRDPATPNAADPSASMSAPTNAEDPGTPEVSTRPATRHSPTTADPAGEAGATAGPDASNAAEPAALGRRAKRHSSAAGSAESADSAAGSSGSGAGEPGASDVAGRSASRHSPTTDPAGEAGSAAGAGVPRAGEPDSLSRWAKRHASATGAAEEAGNTAGSSGSVAGEPGASDVAGRSASRHSPTTDPAGVGVPGAGEPDSLSRWAKRHASATGAAGDAGSAAGPDVSGAAEPGAPGVAGRSAVPGSGDAAEGRDLPRHSAGGESASAESASGTSGGSSADDATSGMAVTWDSGDGGVSSGLAGLSSGGILRGSGAGAASSYEETKAELARMMSALNAKSLAARGNNGARRSPDPEPPAPPEPPRPPTPEPRPAVEPEPPAEPERATAPEPEPGRTAAPGQRSGLMAAFDALTGPVPGLQAAFDDAPELPARKPAQSWAELRSAATVESPADDLFGAEADDTPKPRSSLRDAFAEFGVAEKKVTEPVKETVQETTYDESIGPRPRPAGPLRRGEKSSATIASLLTEALAAYQSTAEDVESDGAPERFGSFAGDDPERGRPGASGRHRSTE